MPGFLLDTHLVLWYAASSSRLSETVKTILSAPESVLYISIVSWWEIALKHSINKLPLAVPLTALMTDMEYRGFRSLPIEPAHILQLSTLPFPASGHRDPFDRLLIAQALSANLTLLSSDGKFSAYPVRCQF